MKEHMAQAIRKAPSFGDFLSFLHQYTVVLKDRPYDNHTSMFIYLHAQHLTIFVETNILGIQPEALTANVHAILADQTSLVGAHAAFARSFSVFLWMRVPNSLVSHIVYVLSFS